LKGSFGYNSFEGSDDSQSFDTKYYRANLAVANWEEF
jgi:OOP family OmpA-OmpF porin